VPHGLGFKVSKINTIVFRGYLKMSKFEQKSNKNGTSMVAALGKLQ
jgi:hypothetical protein